MILPFHLYADAETLEKQYEEYGKEQP